MIHPTLFGNVMRHWTAMIVVPLATLTANLDRANSQIYQESTAPNLQVRCSGPARRRVGENAEFIIQVTNKATVTLKGIRIANSYDSTLEPMAATDGYVVSDNSLVWKTASLAPGKTLRRQVNCKCLREARSACNRVSVSVEGSLAADDEACLEISCSIDRLPLSEDDADDAPSLIIRKPLRVGTAQVGEEPVKEQSVDSATRPSDDKKSQEAEKQAIASAETWLALIDQEKYAEGWESAAAYLKNAVDKDPFVKALAATRKPLGKMKSRQLKSKEYKTTLPGVPDGEYVVIQFETSFENKKSAIETITPMLEKDGTWKVSGYYIK